MVATFRQPFDLLAETTVTAGRAAADGTGGSTKTEIWLCRQSGANSSLEAEFHVHREETGNFIKYRGFGRLTSRKRAVFQYITDEIPYAQEQGIFSILAGNIRETSGTLSGSILAFQGLGCGIASDRRFRVRVLVLGTQHHAVSMQQNTTECRHRGRMGKDDRAKRSRALGRLTMHAPSGIPVLRTR